MMGPYWHILADWVRKTGTFSLKTFVFIHYSFVDLTMDLKASISIVYGLSGWLILAHKNRYVT